MDEQSELLWASTEFNIETTFVFGAWCDSDKILANFYNELNSQLNAWSMYPWYNKPPCITMMDGYVLGTHVITYIYQEEWLLTSILYKLSLKFPEIWLRMKDTEGEFLFIACHDVIPDEYDHPVGENRIWLRNGEWKVIPHHFHYDRGLTTQEAKDFVVAVGDRKCIVINEISSKLDTILAAYPENILEEFVEMEILVDKSVANNISYKTIGRLCAEVMQEEISPKESHGDTMVKISVPDIFSHMLKVGTALERGSVLTSAMKTCDIDFSEPAETGDLQDMLIAHGQIKSRVNPKPFVASDEALPDNLEAKLDSFFNDMSAGLEGIDNAPKYKLEDVDEDDFFEFFITQVLKVPVEELDNYRADPETRSEVSDALQQLMHAMTMDESGPASSLLNNL